MSFSNGDGAAAGRASVLITGCSAGGIGHALVIAFQKRGLLVFATARNPDSMSALQDLSNVHLLTLDVTEPESVTAAVAKVTGVTGGKLDYLINNAGRNYHMPLLDTDIEEGKRLFEANFWGVIRVTQYFAPLLVESKGMVVNIGSLVTNLYAHGLVSTHEKIRDGVYSASKCALTKYGEVLAAELSPFHVSVLTVSTGSIDTLIGARREPDPLPSGSLYKPIEKTLTDRASHNDNITRSTAQDYAEKVVGDVLGGKKNMVWRGKNASMARWGSWLFPRWLTDHLLFEGTGLYELTEHNKIR